MALTDYTFTYRGLSFGKGYDIAPETITGLDDLAVLAGDVRLPRGHGNIQGLHTVNAREVTMTLFVTGDKRSQDLADLVASVYETFQPQDGTAEPLVWKEPGEVEKRLYVSTIGRTRPRNPSTTHGKQMVTVRLRANDPRIYAEAEQSTNLVVYNATGGGTDYDFDYGIDFTLDSSTEKTLTNNGDANAYPLLRFYGPGTGTVTGVELTNTTTGESIDIDTTLLTGQILNADMRRIVTADIDDTPYINLGGSTRYGDWQQPRDPFYLAPGDNAIRFEVTGTSTDALCVVSYRDTWL